MRMVRGDSMTNKVYILNNLTLLDEGEIVVETAYIHEKINDKYTFDFTCYEQEDTELLMNECLIEADNDYFRIASINFSPIDGLYEVSCEHVSYELNALTPEEEEEEEEELHYEGYVWQIVREILEDTRFTWIPSDNVPGRYLFSTKSKGKRTRIIEFCRANGLEIHWRKFEVATQTRRGHDNGLEIELGENLRDLKINTIFNINGTIEQTYDIDFIDLNKLLDENGDPLKPFEFHMGDTVYLKYKDQTVVQRGVAVGYNPFQRALPTIELESPSRDILGVIADSDRTTSGLLNVGGGNNGWKMVFHKYVDFSGQAMYLRTNDTTGRWDGFYVPYEIENDMLNFKINIGKLTLQPNAEFKISINGTAYLESLKVYDENSYGGGDLVYGGEYGENVYEANPEIIYGGYYLAYFQDYPINEIQSYESIYSSGYDNFIFYEAHVKNNVRLYDNKNIRYRYYNVLDTERGLITVYMYRLRDELERLIKNIPNPEDVDEYYLINVAFQNIYGRNFARHFSDYEVIDTYDEIFNLTPRVHEFRDFPLSIGVFIADWDIGDYDILSVHLGSEMNIEIIGTGFEFTPNEQYTYGQQGEVGIDFDDYPYIKK